MLAAATAPTIARSNPRSCVPAIRWRSSAPCSTTAPFPAIYAADLDAILRRGDHRETLMEVAGCFPSLTLWVDAGFAQVSQLQAWTHAGRIVPVIGSESLASSDDLSALLAVVPHAILSLDTRDEQPLGPAELFDEPQRWPDRVVVMTLDRVGAGQGPALAAPARYAGTGPNQEGDRRRRSA